MTWEQVAAFVVGVLATARFTRLVVDDDFPPVAAVRDWYIVKTGEGKWSELVQCPFCFATWPGLLNLLAAWLSDLAVWWWLPNIWFAGIYLAGMIVVRDIPAEDRE